MHLHKNAFTQLYSLILGAEVGQSKQNLVRVFFFFCAVTLNFEQAQSSLNSAVQSGILLKKNEAKFHYKLYPKVNLFFRRENASHSSYVIFAKMAYMPT